MPVVLQLSMVECGAACLSMIASYYGRPVGLRECREKWGIGRDGLSALTLLKAGRALGLGASAVSIRAVENLATLEGPVILHWSFSHFVVLERITDHGASIVDPAIGRRLVSLSEVSKKFTGVVLTFTAPTDPRYQQSKRSRPWAEYLSYIPTTKTAKRLAVQVVAISILLQGVALLFPLFTKTLIDDVLPQRLEGALPVLLAVVLVTTLLQGVSRFLRAVLIGRLQASLDESVMVAFCRHLVRLPMSYFHLHTAGDLLMRVSGNTQVREMLANQGLGLLLDTIFVFAYGAAIAVWSPLFVSVIAAVAALQATIMLVSSRATRRTTDEYIRGQAEAQGLLVQILVGIGSLKAAGVETDAAERWVEKFAKQLHVSTKRHLTLAATDAAMTVARGLPQVAILWVGAWFVIDGYASTGTLIGLSSLAAAMLAPIASIAGAAQQWQMTTGQVERLVDVIRTSPEQAEDGLRRDLRVDGNIAVRNVTFRYATEAPPVLDGISFTVQKGQRVVIVGATGSGKSSLLKLVLGLLRPDEGEVHISGVPLESLEYRSVRRQIGTVMQETPVFGETIGESIALGAPGATLADIRGAAKIAEVDRDIDKMPLKYDTPLSDGGATVSGGQRQRIAVARAVLRRPSLLIFDEATSQLDEMTERRIHANLMALGCTLILVSHRLAVTRSADLVLVMKDGRITERGDHASLVKANGLYASLVAKGERPPSDRVSEAAPPMGGSMPSAV